MASPAISIGMPVFNGAAHLEQALTSLLAQSFTDFEIILSDNASTDATAEIIARFAARDPRIRLFRQTENIGGLANFRFVLEKATAPFFMWAAYDDWHDTNYLAALHAALCADPEKHMASATIQRVLVDGRVAEITPMPPMRDYGRIHRILKQLSLSRGGSLYGLYRRDAIYDAYLRAERDFPYVWAADHLTILPFFVNDRAIGVPDTNFYNRDTGISTPRYRPQTARDLWPFAWSFLRFAVRVVLRSRLRWWEKAVCLIYLPVYSNSKAVKWRRLLLRRRVGVKEPG